MGIKKIECVTQEKYFSTMHYKKKVRKINIIDSSDGLPRYKEIK